MKYGKYMFVLLLIVFGCFQTSFGRFQDKLYCDIGKENVVISLDNKKFYTCKVYIRYIEAQMKKVYNDMLIIQKYIDKQEDLGYWKPLKNNKVILLNQLQNMRLNILAHMKTFETNLFETSKKYFLNSIGDYKKTLTRSLEGAQKLNDPSLAGYALLVQQQLKVIESISKSTTFDGLNAGIQRYVYFKQQLSGK